MNFFNAGLAFFCFMSDRFFCSGVGLLKVSINFKASDIDLYQKLWHFSCWKSWLVLVAAVEIWDGEDFCWEKCRCVVFLNARASGTMQSLVQQHACLWLQAKSIHSSWSFACILRLLNVHEPRTGGRIQSATESLFRWAPWAQPQAFFLWRLNFGMNRYIYIYVLRSYGCFLWQTSPHFWRPHTTSPKKITAVLLLSTCSQRMIQHDLTFLIIEYIMSYHYNQLHQEWKTSCLRLFQIIQIIITYTPEN